MALPFLPNLTFAAIKGLPWKWIGIGVLVVGCLVGLWLLKGIYTKQVDKISEISTQLEAIKQENAGLKKQNEEYDIAIGLIQQKMAEIETANTEIRTLVSENQKKLPKLENKLNSIITKPNLVEGEAEEKLNAEFAFRLECLQAIVNGQKQPDGC